MCDGGFVCSVHIGIYMCVFIHIYVAIKIYDYILRYMFYRAADQRRRGKLILFDIASAYFFMFVIFVHIYIYSYIYIERGVRQRGGGGSLGMCGAVRARCSLATIWYITFASICIYDDLLYDVYS